MKYIFVAAIWLGASTANCDELLRLKLAMDEFGNCTVSVKMTDESLENATEFEGQPVRLSRLSKSTVAKNSTGAVRVLHDFADPDNFDHVFGGWSGMPNVNSRFDKRLQCLLMTSAKNDDATVTYSYRSPPPLTVVCDRYPMARNSTIRLHLVNDAVGVLGVVLTTADQAQRGTARVAAFWSDINDGRRGKRLNLLSPTEFTFDDGTDQQFRLPLPNTKLNDIFRLNIRANSSPQQVHHEITGLLVEGRVAPLFGLVFDERQGDIFVKGFVAGSIAHQSDVKVGDIVRSINGTEPSGLREAVSLVGNTVLGETLTLDIERAGQRKTIAILSE